MDLTYLSAYEQAKLIRDREISAEELVSATLDKITRTDEAGGIHAFITLCPEQALRKAREVDRKIAAGESIGLLAGVPYSAKDVYCTHGIQTTAGSKILDGWIPPYDATVIEKMNAADAVLIGKTNCDEFAMGGTNETSAYHPLPRNPRDLSRVPGGSSGGSAAAIAAFEGALSIGTDTGGSIREPASFCGVVGLKPTYGRVSRYGVIPMASSMDTPGPLTRTVRDAALALQCMAGFDQHDQTSAQVPTEDYLAELEKGVRGMRIGISPDMTRITAVNHNGEIDTFDIDPEIQSAVFHTADVLSKLGAEIIENVPMPNTRYSMPAYFVISRIEAYSNLQRFDGLKYGRAAENPIKDMNDLYSQSRGEGFGYQTKLRILTGLFMSKKEFYEKYYLRAKKARALIRSDYDQVFDPNGKWRLNALLTPTTPSTAFSFNHLNSDSFEVQFADQFTAPMNFAGTPGISFPAGVSSEGLPIGVQAAGYDFCEAKILRAAFAAEQAFLNEASGTGGMLK